MTVTLKSTGAADVILCDGADSAGTVGKHIGPLGDGESELKWKIQQADAIGAPAQTPIDRLNGENVFDLSTYVEFATEADATSFRLSWAAGLPRTGAYLVVRHSDSLSQTFTPAVLESCKVSQTGLCCVVLYKFQTGVPITRA
jgi:hypothetical protein